MGISVLFAMGINSPPTFGREEDNLPVIHLAEKSTMFPYSTQYEYFAFSCNRDTVSCDRDTTLDYIVIIDSCKST